MDESDLTLERDAVNRLRWRIRVKGEPGFITGTIDPGTDEPPKSAGHYAFHWGTDEGRGAWRPVTEGEWRDEMQARAAAREWLDSAFNDRRTNA
jgi:hypothetical protein